MEAPNVSQMDKTTLIKWIDDYFNRQPEALIEYITRSHFGALQIAIFNHYRDQPRFNTTGLILARTPMNLQTTELRSLLTAATPESLALTALSLLRSFHNLPLPIYSQALKIALGQLSLKDLRGQAVHVSKTYKDDSESEEDPEMM